MAAKKPKKRARAPGRPSKLDAKVQRAICKALEVGLYVETAAELSGIAVRTLYGWLDRGANGESPYAEFVQAVARARARAEARLFGRALLGDSEGVGFGQARAATWALERTRPQRYGARVNLKIEAEVERVLQVVRELCSAEDFDRICARLERDHGEGSEETPASGAAV